ncbi:MAG: ABC transporter permease [Candidatus Hermodarchaeota archaeon]
MLNKPIVPKIPIIISLYTQLRRSFAFTVKDIKIYYNKGPLVIQGILFPLVFFFAFTLGRPLKPTYVISGLMFLVLFLTVTSIGSVILPWETREKTLDTIITYPISIYTILLGNLWSSLIFGTILTLVSLLIGVIFFNLFTSVNVILIVFSIIVAGFLFSSFGLLLTIPPGDNPSGIMILTLIIKLPVLFFSPLFQPITFNIINLVNPVVYFLDILNVSLGDSSIFGDLFIYIDLGILSVSGAFCLFFAFFFHSKTLQKRICR